MIDVAASSDEHVRVCLARHPDVREVKVGDHPGVHFQIGNWSRNVWVGKPDLEVAGLVELMDNNPMVCADETAVPDALSTLALIALGPIAWAGMILEPPSVVSSIDGDEDLLAEFLKSAGWHGGADLHYEERNLGGVCAAMAMASIPTPADWSEIDDLYDERYGRSFFVRLDQESEWEPSLVAGKPHAAYRLSYTPGDLASLLSIQVLADRHGKCGAAQVVHAMNVMAGFEESLGAA
jgi:hypothetical protein